MSYVLHNTANIDGYIKSASFFFHFYLPYLYDFYHYFVM